MTHGKLGTRSLRATATAMSEPAFVHLHVHSQYSMLEGAIRVKELCSRVKELGMSAVALTDHGNMHGAIDFYQKASASGVQPILGCEVAIGHAFPGDKPDKHGQHRPYHLPMLAGSVEGYRNLIALVSRAWLDPPEGAPVQTDLSVLERHAKGLVVMTGCLGGLVPQGLLQHSPEVARATLATLKEMLDPGHLFVELQDHGLLEQAPLNRILIELARELDLPVVASNDAHYLRRDDAGAQRALTCIASGMSLDEAEQSGVQSDEMFLKSPREMASTFGDIPGALSNTLLIAEMCKVKLDLGKPMLPNFRDEGGRVVEDIDELFAGLCRKGLDRRFEFFRKQAKRFDAPKYRERLEVEIRVICGMKFPGYFLIVQDFINWGKNNGVPVGPGRGSGAGSLVAYALGITDIDPIPYDLLFERFLNPERVSMPDFDVDFCMLKREKVIDYVRQKYGADSVGQIATFQVLKAKSCVRDVGRIMGMPLADVNAIASLVPDPVLGKTVSLKEAMEKEPKLKAKYDTEPASRATIDMAMKLENLNRHAGMHAAGIVISEGPLWNTVPVFRGSGQFAVTQYAKDEVEAAGLVKFDFLGLTTLTVLDFAHEMIRKRPDEIARVAKGGEVFNVDNIPLETNDADPERAKKAKETFDLLASGETTGVFQLESSGMQKLFKDLKPDCFEDIVAAVALYRPGPLGSGMVEDFVARKNGRAKIAYPDDSLKEVLESTYGVIVYQEQVMMVARKMGGYTLGGADLLRRAMGKKKVEEMAKQKATFVEGAKKLGHKEEKAVEVFDLLEYFAGYGFNKCVVASTEVMDATTGERATVGDLFARRRPFTVHALGDDGKLKPRAVVDVMSNGGKQVFELRTAQGRRIVATDNHPFRTWDGWTELKDLRVGDRLAAPRRLSVPSTKRWARHELVALGWLISEGNLCHPTSLYFFNRNPAAVDDFVTAASLFPDTVARIDERRNGAYEVCLNTGRDSWLREHIRARGPRGGDPTAPIRSGAWWWAHDLGLLGVKAPEKSIPAAVFTLCDDDVALLLGRLWSGDGFIANVDQYAPFYATSSRRLAVDVQTLLLRLGVVSGVHEKRFKYRGGEREGYTVHLLGDGSAETFLARVCPEIVGRRPQVEQLRAHLARVRRGSSKDTIPAAVRELVDGERQRRGLPWAELEARSGCSMKEFYGRGSAGKRGFRRSTIGALAESLGSPALAAHARSDVFWDRIVSITPLGEEETFDLTVERDHNFVADGLVVHNSHSAAYALITYQTAYLKRHFPAEFMAATLCSDLGKIEKLVGTINEARSLGIPVLVPDVNESDRYFTVVYSPTPQPVPRKPANRIEADPYRPRIRVGLGGIKGVGDAAVESVIEARAAGPFVDLFDFTARVDPRRVNKSVVEAMVASGCFDDTLARTGASRAQCHGAIERALERGKGAAKERSSGQMGLFGMKESLQPTNGYPEVQPWDLTDGLKRERTALGLYLTGHPLDRYAAEAARFSGTTTTAIKETPNNTEVTIAGVIEGYREKVPKSGGRMAFFFIEDRVGRTEAIVRAKVFDAVAPNLKEGEALLIKGKVRMEFKRDEEGEIDKDTPEDELPRTLWVEEATPLGDALRARTRAVILRLDGANLKEGEVTYRRLEQLKRALAEHPGRIPVQAVVKLPGGEVGVRLARVGIDPSEALLAQIERIFGSKVAELRS